MVAHKLAVISLGSKSSQMVIDAAKEYFEQVDKIDIDELRVADSEEHLVLAARVTEYIQSLNMSGRDTETIEALRPEITARAYRILFGS